MLQKPAEETACTDGNQRSVMAAGGLRPRQLVLISEKSQLWVWGRKAWSRKGKKQGGRKSEQPPNHHQPQPLTVDIKCTRVCTLSIRLYSHQQACKDRTSTFSETLVCEQSAHQTQIQRLTASAKPLVFHPKCLISGWKTGFVSNAGKLPRFLFCTNSAASLFVRYCQSDRKKKGIELLPKWDYQLLLD